MSNLKGNSERSSVNHIRQIYAQNATGKRKIRSCRIIDFDPESRIQSDDRIESIRKNSFGERITRTVLNLNRIKKRAVYPKFFVGRLGSGQSQNDGGTDLIAGKRDGICRRTVRACKICLVCQCNFCHKILLKVILRDFHTRNNSICFIFYRCLQFSYNFYIGRRI